MKKIINTDNQSNINVKDDQLRDQVMSQIMTQVGNHIHRQTWEQVNTLCSMELESQVYNKFKAWKKL